MLAGSDATEFELQTVFPGRQLKHQFTPLSYLGCLEFVPGLVRAPSETWVNRI